MENIPLKIGKKGVSVNYFVNLRVECHFLKLGYNESDFQKKKKKAISVIYPKI